jgi:hypothetical protein
VQASIQDKVAFHLTCIFIILERERWCWGTLYFERAIRICLLDFVLSVNSNEIFLRSFLFIE